MYKLYLTRGERRVVSLLTVAILCIALLPVALGSDLSKSYAPHIIFIYTILGALIFSVRSSILAFLSPNSLVFFYSSISLLLGSIAFKLEAVLVIRNLIAYGQHQHTGLALTFIMLGLISMPIFEVAHKRIYSDRTASPKLGKSHLAVMLLLAVPLTFAGIDFAVVGGSGSLSPYLASLISITILIYASRLNRFIRYFMYLGVFATMVSIFSQDKRIAVFLIFAILLLEARRGALVFNLKGILFATCALGAVIYGILVMSINRGYGSFLDIGGVLEASGFVLEYIKSDFFLAGFFQNIEASYFYFHYLNAAELVLGGEVDPSLGSTLLKPLFIPFPRSLIPWKPESIIDLYTVAHDPGFRLVGGSWVVNFGAEYLWNFHILGLILFSVFAKINAVFYRALLSPKIGRKPYFSVFMLFAYMNIITYARGSGLDLFAFSLVVVGAIVFLSAVAHAALRFPSRPVVVKRDF